MRAQELRDRLAAVRNFDVKIDDNVKIEEVVIDITNSTVYLYTQPLATKQEEFERMEEPTEKSELDKLQELIRQKGGKK